MSKENPTKTKTRIAFIGKFKRLHDEEYIALSFEQIGCEVLRIEESLLTFQILGIIEEFKPDFVLWAKLSISQPEIVREALRKYKTVCWIFDLYMGYSREYRLYTHPAFTADYLVSTDGGHQDKFKEKGFNHFCVRQGILKDECVMFEGKQQDTIVFVGSNNALNTDRIKKISFIEQEYGDKFKWYGKKDTNELRGLDLNRIFADNKIIIGDSVYSPFYWSNRIVETLGRGGFLIHREVEGLKEEYPYLVTYDGTNEDLKSKIDYYLTHEEERQEIIKNNFEWVRDNYTMDKQCQKLLNYIS